MLENRVAAALAKECFITHQHIGRLQLARGKFGEEAVGLAERAHHLFSNISTPPGYSPPGCGQNPATADRRRENLPEKSWADRSIFRIAREKDTKDSRRALCPAARSWSPVDSP